MYHILTSLYTYWVHVYIRSKSNYCSLYNLHSEQQGAYRCVFDGESARLMHYACVSAIFLHDESAHLQTHTAPTSNLLYLCTFVLLACVCMCLFAKVDVWIINAENCSCQMLQRLILDDRRWWKSLSLRSPHAFAQYLVSLSAKSEMLIDSEITRPILSLCERSFAYTHYLFAIYSFFLPAHWLLVSSFSHRVSAIFK